MHVCLDPFMFVFIFEGLRRYCIYVSRCMCFYVYMYTCIFTCRHIDTRIHLYIHIHTYICVYTCATYTCVPFEVYRYWKFHGPHLGSCILNLTWSLGPWSPVRGHRALDPRLVAQGLFGGSSPYVAASES